MRGNIDQLERMELHLASHSGTASGRVADLTQRQDDPPALSVKGEDLSPEQPCLHQVPCHLRLRYAVQTRGVEFKPEEARTKWISYY